MHSPTPTPSPSPSPLSSVQPLQPRTRLRLRPRQPSVPSPSHSDVQTLHLPSPSPAPIPNHIPSHIPNSIFNHIPDPITHTQHPPSPSPGLVPGLAPETETDTGQGQGQGHGQGQVRENWTLLECIGRGAHAAVHRAIAHPSGEIVAVKCIPRPLSQGPKGTFCSSSPSLIPQEVQLLKTLKHVHVLRYVGFVLAPNMLYVLTEHCPRGSLQGLYRSQGPLGEKEVRCYTVDILKGLGYLHHHRVIHRDLKAANILIAQDGVLKLADFGLATLIPSPSIPLPAPSPTSNSTSISQSQAQPPPSAAAVAASVAGSPYWMAPEVISHRAPASTASDIWAMAATVLELLQARPPHSHLPPHTALYTIASTQIMPLPPDLSQPARLFLHAAFHPEPWRRPSAAALLSHPWLSPPRSTDQVPSLCPAPSTPTSHRARGLSAIQPPHSAPAPKVPSDHHHQQQWNDALRSPSRRQSLYAHPLSSPICHSSVSVSASRQGSPSPARHVLQPRLRTQPLGVRAESSPSPFWTGESLSGDRSNAENHQGNNLPRKKSQSLCIL